MGRRARHHVVSRGYQRNFAEGEQILLIDKRTRTYWSVGTRDAFVERNFSSWLRPDRTWDDRLEDEWREIEAHSLPATRRIGTNDELPGDRIAVKNVMAMHIARSYGFYQLHLRLSDLAAAQVGAEAATDQRIIDTFESDFGRGPEPDEIESYVRRRMEGIKEQRTFLVERMIHVYNWAVETFLGQLELRVLRAPQPLEWVTGDSPVVVTDKRFFRFLSRGQVAMGDAEVAYMPLSRTVIVDAWKGNQPRPDTEVDRLTCQKINWLVWRNSLRYLACHPSASPSRLLAGTPLRQSRAADACRESRS